MTPSPTQPHHIDRDELIRSHLPLAYRLAACYRGSEAQYDDLVRAAELGLVRAAEQFAPASGVDFEKLATRMITGELSVLFRERHSARRAAWARRPDERATCVEGAQRRISTALGAGRRVQGLARLLTLDADVVADALVAAAGRETVTLNLPVQRRHGRIIDPRHGGSVTPAAA